MKNITTILVLFLSFGIYSQINIDSLQNVLDKTTPNKTNFENYIKVIQNYQPDNIEASQAIGSWLIKNTNSTIFLENQANAYLNLGIKYSDADNVELAIKNVINATRIAEKNNFYEILSKSYNELGNIYRYHKQLDKSIEFFKKSIAISESNHLYRYSAITKYNLAGTYLSKGYNNTDTIKMSIKIINESIALMKKLKDTASIITFSNGISQAYTDLKDYDSGLKILNDTEPLIKSTNDESLFVTHYLRMGKIYNDKGDFKKAIQNYDKSLALALKYKMHRWEYNVYMGYAETYENLGNYKQANKFNILYSDLRDSLTDVENFKAASDMQNLYETQKKETEIIKLKTTNEKKANLNKILIGTSIGLLLIGFLGYRNFRNKRKIQNLKITELEKDKQLLAIDAMLKGQEEERGRIAKDLHDGLGGLLSGTKLSFTNMRENLILTPENALQFEKSLNMLDTTIADLRKVAHNLMPEALVKFGLDEALRDFCNSIQAATTIKVDYQKLGVERKINTTTQTFIYRIIQELINNAVKHAQAKEILVQLAFTDKKIIITIEDNGKGYDANRVKNKKGDGLNNIEYRVQYLNGTIDTISSPNNGTAVNIELNA
ncbi:sensor histidine kinase [Flavobacterium sp.]|uniref:tetratricopeptide repeat-containing sensor histidine kinase n=1 Tax=Flavobacterium sp. TaxID=239 RepID=UPI00286D1572|nr:sensor histidine kinase [Flavobacterium sp.]